jgi:hypothetical protein
MITIEFTEDELKAQLQLNDAALRHLGSGAVDVFVHLRNKYTEASMRAKLAMVKPNGKSAEEQLQ